MQGLLKFVASSAAGLAVGAVIASLVAPKSGQELQADASALFERVRTEGEQARVEAEEQAAERFRQRVNDPSAFGSRS